MFKIQGTIVYALVLSVLLCNGCSALKSNSDFLNTAEDTTQQKPVEPIDINPSVLR